MASIKFFLLGLLLIGLINSGHSRPDPATENDDTYQNDAENEYQDDADDYAADYEDDSSKDQSTNQRNQGKPAFFEQDKISKTANASQTVALVCPVKNFDPNTHVIMWYNYTSLLFQKENKLSKDHRISLDENHSIHIKNVQVTDSNTYLCKVFPEQITFTVDLKVHGPLTHVDIIANERFVTREKLTYDHRRPSPEFHGEVLKLECRASGGNPAPRITWSHKGEKLEHGFRTKHIHVYNNTLEIRHITRKDAGIYQCLADNKIGKPVHSHVELIVSHKPTFMKEEDCINTNIGQTVSLHCLYESNPAPDHVHWYMDGQRIQDSEKHKIKNHNEKDGQNFRTTLEIRNVEQQDLHEYNCEVLNAIGKAKSKIFLTLTPSNPQLISHSYKGGVLTAKWEVHSHQPLMEINVMTRGNDGKWNVHPTKVTDEHKPKNNVWTIKTQTELENGDYEIQAKAKNADGWSVINSDLHKLHLEQEKKINLPDTIDFVEDDTDEIRVATLGGTGGSQSISRVSFSIITLLISAVLFICH